MFPPRKPRWCWPRFPSCGCARRLRPPIWSARSGLRARCNDCSVALSPRAWFLISAREWFVRTAKSCGLRPTSGFLLWLAELRRAGEDLNWRSADVGAFLRAIAAFPRAEAAVAAAKRALRDGFEMNYVAEKKARLNKLVAAAIGPAAALYRVETIGRRPHSRYRLATPPDCITIIPARASDGSIDHAESSQH